ncbi:hypothetical protein IAG25_38765 [Caballeronia sp. EK]|uniref:hypothetical protein n=1 Tax=Caballeronia sp. EK TaxID=2767469 RepID=UPI001656548D|nr:hypothetical protein [Caballeronia sp. EK]MBC8642745.1 hypothetical protein [Caballeronia sp. EK]
MTLFDPIAARALLSLTDAELGRLFKLALVRTAGLVTALNLDLDSIRDENESRRKTARSSRQKPTPALLVAKAKLIHESHFRAATNVSEKTLRKEVSAGRIFSVDIEGESYFPTFFLVKQLDQKCLAKVARKLRDLPGWSRWEFFTRPNEALGNLTPLQALFYGDRKQVSRAAVKFVEG